MTADLAAANARYVLTVPQSLFETKPEVLRIIEAAERDDPSPGPYRIHRMPLWNPLGWHRHASKDRIYEMRPWEHDTMQPKYGINLGVEYTHTLGVAELYDYEWYFNGFPWHRARRRARRDRWASSWGRRSFIILAAPSICGTPAISSSLTFPPAGATSIAASPPSYSRASKSTPLPIDSAVPIRAEECNELGRNHDFRIMRNRQEFPRAWVVHDARVNHALHRPFPGDPQRSHAGDPLRR